MSAVITGLVIITIGILLVWVVTKVSELFGDWHDS